MPSNHLILCHPLPVITTFAMLYWNYFFKCLFKHATSSEKPILSLFYLKLIFQEAFLMVQWLRLRASTAGGTGSISGWATKIPHTQQRSRFNSSKRIDFPTHPGCLLSQINGCPLLIACLTDPFLKFHVSPPRIYASRGAGSITLLSVYFQHLTLGHRKY